MLDILCINPLTPNDNYSGRTAPLTSKHWILYIYSTNIGTEYFKHGIYSTASKTKYLGTTVTKDNLIEKEIKERNAAGNRASFANQKILQSKLISKKTKMKLYKALTRPVAVYGSECWVLTENIQQKLLVFERKILRRIFCPTQKANCEWRLKTNEELEKAINNENIVRYIKYK